MVGKWLDKLARVLTGEDAMDEAREALRVAWSANAKLKLEPIRTSVANATVMTAVIEDIGEEELVISQPVIGGVTRPLVSGELLRLSFSTKEFGNVTGETEVLGRQRIASGGGKALRGYRLSMPVELFPDDRRSNKRSPSSLNLAREVELYRQDDSEPIRGVVQNLSVGGMQIRTHEAQQSLRPGDRVRLVVHLPRPVGGLNRMVTVARLAGSRVQRHQVIGIAFEREVEGLRQLLSRDVEPNGEAGNGEAARRAAAAPQAPRSASASRRPVR